VIQLVPIETIAEKFWSSLTVTTVINQSILTNKLLIGENLITEKLKKLKQF